MIVLALWMALQVSPELNRHVNAGLAAKQRGDLKTAIAEFEKVAELAPQLAAAHVNLGAVYLANRDFGPATIALRRALALQEDLPGAHGMLGTALLAQGYAAEAIVHLEKGRMDDVLGVALMEAGREREAVDLLEAALVKRPEDTDVLYYLGQAHGKLARTVGERLTGQFQDSARGKQLMAEAYVAAGNREAAMKAFREAIALRRDLRGIHLAMGELHLSSGDYQAAEKEFSEEVSLTPGSAVAAYRLGSVRLQLGRAAEALRELERSEKLKPGMPETLLELGRARLETGASEGAEKAFLQLISIEPEGKLAESAHFQLSQLYRKLNRSGEAAEHQARFRAMRSKRP